MDTDDISYPLIWKVNYSFSASTLVHVTASDEEGWYLIKHRYRSSVEDALSTTISEIVDLFPEVHHKIYEKLLKIRNNEPFGLQEYYIIMIRQIEGSAEHPTDNGDLLKTLRMTWTIEYRETSNLVWLVVATNQDGHKLKIHDLTADPGELLKKMLRSIISFQLLRKSTVFQKPTKVAKRNPEMITPFEVLISMDWNRKLTWYE
ncbi:MAG: hypothetical protein WBI14_08610 [Anaerolineaceae bacterium]